MFAFTNVVFANPALAPVARDVFVGITVPATTSSFGGVRLTLLQGFSGSSFYDIPGAGMPTSPREHPQN